MKIKIDPDLCEGNGVCELVAPELFRVEQDDQAKLLVEDPDESLRSELEDAVNGCPRAAISVEG